MERGFTLVDMLGIRGGECVSLIGGGGKTSTMLALAAELTREGRSVAIGTTTKIWPVEGMSHVLCEDGVELPGRLRRLLEAQGRAVFGAREGPDCKVYGVTPETVCRVVADRVAATVLVEADGSAGRPLKAHGPGEPVVPKCTGCVVVVAGLDAIGMPVSEKSVHRLSAFCHLTGLGEGDVIGTEHVAAVLRAGADFAPQGSRVAFVLNKLSDTRLAPASAVADDLSALAPGSAIVGCRHGRPVTVFRRGSRVGAGSLR